MGVLRTAVVLGSLALTVPALAQDGRFGWDRTRGERGRDDRAKDDRGNRGGRGSPRGADDRTSRDATPRDDARSDPRNVPRVGKPDGSGRESGGRDVGNREPGSRDLGNRDFSNRSSGNRGVGREYGRGNDRGYDRGYDRGHDRRPEPRVRVEMYRRDREVRYDFDRRRRDAIIISRFFRGNHGRGLGGRDRYIRLERRDFRPGIYLSAIILSELDVLPFDLELDLGPLPWYCERRIYGRTVVVIDTRYGLVVDAFDIDW